LTLNSGNVDFLTFMNSEHPFSQFQYRVFLFGFNISARGIIFSFGTITALGPFMLVFLKDLSLKVPVEKWDVQLKN